MAGHLVAIYEGVPYQTKSLSEPPLYQIRRYLAPGEIGPARAFAISDSGLDYIKSQTGYSQTVVVGPNNMLEIGYGHLIALDETIDGQKFDADTIQMYVQTGGQNQLTALSISDAEALLVADIRAVEDYLSATLTCSLTQSQFDAMCSFVFHLSLDQVRSGVVGLDVIRAMNLGRMDVVLGRLSAYSYVNGLLDPNTLVRRTDERDMMSTFTDPVTYGEFEATGTAVSLGQFSVDPGVKTAIDTACDTYEVDKKFAYLMVAQLSGFNPAAEKSLIGSKGLFLLSPEMSAYYGTGGLEFDPESNATAGVRFIADAKTAFNTVMGRNPTGPELYSCMLLGLSAGPEYAKIVANNPGGSATAAVEMLLPGMTKNFPALFSLRDGTSQTNTQFMGYLGSVYEERYSTFS